jgi:preprotein translocase subunit SecG
MEILSKIVYVVMLLSALGVIILVLLQHGKGADMGTGFGAGASGSLFGASGSANFLSRTTKFLAGVFFAATLALSYFATNRPKTGGSVMQNLPAQTAPAPAKSAPVDPTTVPATDAAKTAPAKPAEIPK